MAITGEKVTDYFAIHHKAAEGRRSSRRWARSGLRALPAL
jgi:hypothetical protein